ncbi:MAG: hypothetical protein Q7S98_05860 [Deltaproteobacteria bacterium]|nr:hypothetical protein [Deltaproteobacteria bacterium]
MADTPRIPSSLPVPPASSSEPPAEECAEPFSPAEADALAATVDSSRPDEALSRLVAGGVSVSSGTDGETPRYQFQLPSGVRYSFQVNDPHELSFVPADDPSISLARYRSSEVDQVLAAFDAGASVVAIVGYPGGGKSTSVRDLLKETLESRGESVTVQKLKEVVRKIRSEGIPAGGWPTAPSVLIFDEAVVKEDDWAQLTTVAQLARDYVGRGGKIILVGAGGYFTPERQAELVGWIQTDDMPIVNVTFHVKPLNFRQARELLTNKTTLSDAEKDNYTRLVLRWVPPYLRPLYDFGLDGGSLTEGRSLFFRVLGAKREIPEWLLSGIRVEGLPTDIEAEEALYELGQVERDAAPPPAAGSGGISDDRLFEELLVLRNGFEELHRYIRWRHLPVDHPVLERFLRAVRDDDRYYSEEAMDVVGQLRFEEHFFSTERSLASYFATPSIEDTAGGLADLDETERAQFIPLILAHVADVLKSDPDPAMKDYIFRLLGAMIRHSLLTSNGPNGEAVKDLLFTGLADPDPVVAYQSWQVLRLVSPDEANAVTETSLSSEPSAALTSSPDFDLPRYSRPSYAHQIARFRMVQSLIETSVYSVYPVVVSLDQLTPLHSLADFHPDRERRAGILAAKIDEIRRIITEEGVSDPEKVIGEFLAGAGGAVTVLRLPSGKRLVIDGHHRLAALYQAAREGLIPREWLERIGPVREETVVAGSTSEAVVDRVLTHGVRLTWDDLLPPLTPPRSGGAGGGGISYRSSVEPPVGGSNDDGTLLAGSDVQAIVPSLATGALEVFPVLETRGSPVLTDGESRPTRYLP